MHNYQCKTWQRGRRINVRIDTFPILEHTWKKKICLWLKSKEWLRRRSLDKIGKSRRKKGWKWKS